MKSLPLVDDCRTEARCLAAVLGGTMQIEHGPDDKLKITIELPFNDSGIESAYRLLSAARKAVC